MVLSASPLYRVGSMSFTPEFLSLVLTRKAAHSHFHLFFLETTEDESLSLGLEGSTNGSNFSERRLERLLFFLQRLRAVLDSEDDPESLEPSLESLPDGDEGNILFLFEVPSAWAI